MTENVIINVESKYKDKGLAELKKILSGTNLAMNNMEKAGKQNSDSFIKLQARTIALNAKINDLKKSYTDVGKATKTVHTDTEKLSGGVKNLVSSLPLLSLGLAGVAAGIIKFGVDSFKMGADFQELRSNFIGSAQDLELFRKATAGTVSDGGLITLSNYASDLGVSLKDQALLFSLAEDASDKYGGTVQDNFERVINATDGSARGLRAIGIGVKEYNQELEKLLPNNVKNIDDLDAETQQQIRLEAIIKVKGITIDDVNKKQKSNADILTGLSVLYQNFIVDVGTAANKNIDLDKSFAGLNDSSKILSDTLGKFIANELKELAGNLKASAEEVNQLENAFDSLKSFIRTIDSLDFFSKIDFIMNGGLSMIGTNKTELTDPKSFPPEFTLGGSLKLPIPKFETTGIGKTKSSIGGSTSREKTAVDKIEKTAQEIYIAKLYEIAERLKYSLGQPQTPGLPNKMQGFSIIDLEGISGKVQSGKNEDISSTLLADSETIYQNISSLMNILNVGTYTFVSKLLAGFGAAYQVLGIVGSILSFIPGGGVISKAFGARASGGMVNAGQTYLTGERGIELFTPSVSGMIHNNSQTNKLMNQSLNKSNPINVYVSSNIDQRYLKVGIEKYNANQKYIRA